MLSYITRSTRLEIFRGICNVGVYYFLVFFCEIYEFSIISVTNFLPVSQNLREISFGHLETVKMGNFGSPKSVSRKIRVWLEKKA